MRIIRKGRLLGTVLSVLTFSFAGHASQALAVTPLISNTGPDSTNAISINDSRECEIINNSSVNIDNSVNQNASSGDVDISHNTSVGSDWGSWSPAAWAAKGKTYAEWHAAFTSYMASSAASWQSNWNNGSLPSGSASSGNASNSNSTDFDIDISNGGATCEDNGPGANNGGEIDTTGPGSDNTIVLGSLTMNNLKNNNGVSIGNGAAQNASSGNVSADGNTSAGGGGSGNSGNSNNSGGSVDIDNGDPTHPGNSSGGNTDASINHTGPDSYNAINIGHQSTSSIQNNNNAVVTSYSNQTSQTGNTSNNNNTNTSAGGSGDAGNANGSDADINIQN